jgi:hypothetical protein
MSKKRRLPGGRHLLPPERHAIEAGIAGKPFPGLVYKRGEFDIVGNLLVLPGIGPIPIGGDLPSPGEILRVTLREDGNGWTATFEVEETSTDGSSHSGI